MAEEWQEYDPFTGLYEDYKIDDNGIVSIHRWQDVEPYLDRAKELANGGNSDESWRKRGVGLYATLPAIVLLQLKDKGIDFLDPNAIGAVLREINTNYPYCKTTYKHHELARD